MYLNNLPAVGVLACMFAMCACTTVNVQDGKAVSVSPAGSFAATEECTLRQARIAADVVLKDLGFAVTDERETNGSINLIARGAHDGRVDVRIKTVSEKLTTIEVRGSGGTDRSTRVLLLDRIRSAALATR